MHIAVLLKHIAWTQSQVKMRKSTSTSMIALNSSQVVLQRQLSVGDRCCRDSLGTNKPHQQA